MLMAVVLVGCGATAQGKLADISLGMSKTEVLKVMGSKPISASFQRNREYLWFFHARDIHKVYVEFTNGKVTGYGSHSDYPPIR